MAFILRKSLIVCLIAACLLSVAGCRTGKDEDFTPYVVRVYLEESPQMPASHITDMLLPISGSHITTQAKPVFAEWDIAGAGSFDTDFGLAILLLFTNAASADVYHKTITNQGRRLVFTVNGIPVGARLIDRPVQDGRLFFFPEIEEEEIPELVRGIQKTSTKIHEEHQKRKKW